MLKYKGVYKGLKVDEDMKAFCETTSCRRDLLMGVIENETVPQQIKHTCCDNCSKSCTCLCQCQCDKCTCASTCPNQGVLKSTAEAHIAVSNPEYQLQSQGLKKLVYTITEAERDIFKSRLLDYRQSLLNDEEKQQVLTHPDFTTGFSLYLVTLLVENMDYLESVDSLIRDYPIFSISHAQNIMEILQQISPETAEQDENDQDGPSFNKLSDNSQTSEDDLSDADSTSHFKVYIDFLDGSDLDYSDLEEIEII